MKKLILLIILTSIFNITAKAQSCLPEGIIFTAQAQIDSFQINYPGCTEIEGDVVINGLDITNLNGLIVLTSIGGDMDIGQDYFGNPVLTSLSGLDSLISIGGDLNIYNNETLTSLAGLEGLTTLGGNLAIGSESWGTNPALASISGLESLNSIGGDLWIFGNGSLAVCDEEWLCNYISNPSGSINIFNADGCSSIVEVASACGSIPCLPYGNYRFESQNDIDNFQVAFPGCKDLKGSVSIRGNMTNLSGLEVVNSIEGSIHIIGTPNLSSLQGLENLTSIGDFLGIYNNSSLTSLQGLENIDAGSIQKLYIEDNQSLTDCAAQSICDYLANPGHTLVILENDPGCNSPAEVDTACKYLFMNEISILNKLLIHPNPFNQATTIKYELAQPSTVQLIIYDYLGKQVELIEEKQTQGKQQIIWNTEGLQAGVYFCLLKTKLGTQTMKMIKLK